ncbi:MAG: hypothetical protein A3I07_02970 [Candidatus Doudnabacteria bacterium RIFCSPLOWO2_02_FULL_42_9]|uniref:PNPLA domain-containing protein n=1 Tax=Candidatus Doudnabacteria bacterium RIFCSPHIGHO2_01_FULL_41_86 TaxID=1817821 RepID=A0A1F5N7V9_9BACT|nr:MAG: hypothetical protein A2717_03220 [Candidatus Doudnabacteria bacterium RIFCSPHIGHO2_01_FULL_41_86]OGE75694.1 MAG: hypothetical protein A3K07_00470 [Candidatus Doudnabacteria bacterium RIFCSPHIGHO2_01_43_10]OGE85658.1 MAG: hypothetical protein A3E28_02550 [Candidatus Doudnabacteria bacterium RIFCSPHIGHO2_12_FULL_42_22]OGE87154.1 MAG: hypothetical protein A3C49_00185 [Candidatus Doudnabacteria bacterium RIFCSPHIGHO2_02_FULL_42_25]OGE91992.1 MAG: hypothetical protein A2895_00060 [Candidatus
MTNRPKIGIALSGASGRAIAHIGALEVFREHKITIDYLVGCSSGALIAASFAIGTMEAMKKVFYELSFPSILRFWSLKNAKGGLFHLHNEAMEELLNSVTHNMNFEDIEGPKVGFSATDINTGELVTIKSGSINTAFKASVAVPGLFEPVVWEKHVLVDGGLVNIVPTLPVKEMGADIVIGINIAATKFIYEKKMPIWRGYRFLTNVMGLQFIREKIIPKLSPRLLFRLDSQSDVLEQRDIKIPGVISVMTKAVEHSFRIEEQWDESHVACDLMIEPHVKHYGKTEFSNLDKIYQEGRRAAEAAVPEIKKLIKQYQQKQIAADMDPVRNAF